MAGTQKSKKLLSPKAGALYVRNALDSTPVLSEVPKSANPQSVLSYSPNISEQHRVHIDTKTLLKIEQVKRHLEARGRSADTLDVFKRNNSAYQTDKRNG